MIVAGSQRWRQRHESYRPKGEPLDTRAHEVVALTDDATAKAFVAEHHYKGSYPAARRRFGLYHRSELVGVAVFSQPMHEAVLGALPGATTDSMECGRFVLLDEVPCNGESWFLARCFELLRAEGVVGIVSFSDPAPKTTVLGTTVFGGHIGTIYQATNAVYLGLTPRRTEHVLPDGSVFCARAMSKIRRRERGYRHAAAQLERFGVPPLRDGDDTYEWLHAACADVTRTYRHPGKHKYAWTLQKRDRRHLPKSQPYPKVIAHV